MEYQGDMGLYRAIMILAAPVFAALMLFRLMRGQEDWRSLKGRMGGGPSANATPALWLHGASNGELASVRPLVVAMLARWPDLRLVVSTNTLTGRSHAESCGYINEDRVQVVSAPLDYPVLIRRFLQNNHVTGLLIVENELWPNRIATLASSHLPIAVVGARMSEKSAQRWGRMPDLARSIIGALTAVSAQDDASAARLLALGLPRAAVLPTLNLKSFVVGAVPQHRAKTVLAASTHAGEDATVLDAFATLWAEDHDWRLILAPRHPRRAGEILALAAARRLPIVQRSTGAEFESATAVFLADTMGEMPLWYALAPVTFVAGSLVEKGGHTPYEPVAFGSIVAHGPYLTNFTDSYSLLTQANAALPVYDAPTLETAMRKAGDPVSLRPLADRARAALTGQHEADLDMLVTGLGRVLCLPQI